MAEEEQERGEGGNRKMRKEGERGERQREEGRGEARKTRRDGRAGPLGPLAVCWWWALCGRGHRPLTTLVPCRKEKGYSDLLGSRKGPSPPCVQACKLRGARQGQGLHAGLWKASSSWGLASDKPLLPAVLPPHRFIWYVLSTVPPGIACPVGTFKIREIVPFWRKR